MSADSISSGIEAAKGKALAALVCVSEPSLGQGLVVSQPAQTAAVTAVKPKSPFIRIAVLDAVVEQQLTVRCIAMLAEDASLFAVGRVMLLVSLTHC